VGTRKGWLYADHKAGESGAWGRELENQEHF
jgi:hypothetical protein